MPYSEMLIKPMREEVTRLGVQELKTVDDVDSALASALGVPVLPLVASTGRGLDALRERILPELVAARRPRGASRL